MTAQPDPETGQHERPVPRDLPDQQARPGEDRWDAAPGRASDEEPDTDEDVPDTDEAGSGPRGAPRSGTVHPGDPTPDEPTG
ncbi:hypothetical protein [Streptomyces sp. NPDC007905]|uniref:hypothetical protein n=1 Tax=Streptomyces sp. NPDC007905 TaxID=3364788 RepID=UPI0036E25FCA